MNDDLSSTPSAEAPTPRVQTVLDIGKKMGIVPYEALKELATLLEKESAALREELEVTRAGYVALCQAMDAAQLVHDIDIDWDEFPKRTLCMAHEHITKLETVARELAAALPRHQIHCRIYDFKDSDEARCNCQYGEVHRKFHALTKP